MRKFKHPVQCATLIAPYELNSEEFANLKSQFGISSWVGMRTAPYAFTEHGVSIDVKQYIKMMRCRAPMLDTNPT